jgi:hypothetical protein
MRGTLDGERYYTPGSMAGKLQQGVRPWRPQRVAGETAASNRASLTNAVTPVPAAAEPATAVATKSGPVTRSYLLAVFDWFADVYRKSRQVFQY